MSLQVFGNALSCNGSNQYAIRTTAGSSAINNFTMMCWVYIIAYGAGESSFFQNGANDARGQVLQVTSSGVLNADYHFVTNLSSGYTLNTSTWYHVCLIRNAGTSQLYVNAAAQGSTTGSAPNGGTDNIILGAQGSGGGVISNYFNGYIDDARLYERAISTGELTQVYNRSTNTVAYSDIATTNLFYWYKCDETSGNLIDSSGNGRTLTNTNTATFVTSIVEQKRITVPSRNVVNGRGVNVRPNIFSPGVAR